MKIMDVIKLVCLIIFLISFSCAVITKRIDLDPYTGLFIGASLIILVSILLAFFLCVKRG